MPEYKRLQAILASGQTYSLAGILLPDVVKAPSHAKVFYEKAQERLLTYKARRTHEEFLEVLSASKAACRELGNLTSMYPRPAGLT